MILANIFVLMVMGLLTPFLFVARNYHVFYYLLAGASEEEKSAFHLKQPDEYHYLNQVGIYQAVFN